MERDWGVSEAVVFRVWTLRSSIIISWDLLEMQSLFHPTPENQRLEMGPSSLFNKPDG